MLRILLDAHFSPRAIATRLRADGHDVRALAEEPELEGLADSLVLELAASERRILVTADVKDFPALLRARAEARRPHAGCVLLHGIDHGEYGRILRGLARLFSQRPSVDQWTDAVIFLSRRVTS